jgi:3-hydroxyisobutyrate dehydrogenase-like beta-hydroxyacid dehydrogenase
MLQAIHVCALGEVLKIAEKSGMAVGAVGDALAERPGGTTTNLAWRDYQNDPYPINFSVRWLMKDLTYAKKLANALNVPFLNEALKKYSDAVERGAGDKDWTIVMRD